MIITLTILAVAAAFFISGQVRSDLVALSALILMMLCGILTPVEALSGFSNSIVVMMIGLFVVGGGIFHTGLAKMVSSKLLQLSGTNETTLLIAIMLVAAVFSTMVSNTGTVAVMMPIVVSIAVSAQINPGRLLMPLAFASSCGGVMTLIGTPPNLVIQQTLIARGHEGLSFFSFTPIGLVGLCSGIIGLLFLRKFLPANEVVKGKKHKRRSVDELATRYQLAGNLFRVRVKENSTVKFKKLAELDISTQFGLNIIEVRRKTSTKNQFLKTIDQEIGGPATRIAVGDILYLYGSFDAVCEFAKTCGLLLLDNQAPEKQQDPGTERYATAQVGIAEVMLTPRSSLIGQPVMRAGFRNKYRVNVLGIQRKDTLLLHNLKDVKMNLGDALLIQGTWEDIALLAAEQTDFVVVGQPLEEARNVTLDHKAPIAAGILLLMIILLVAEIVPGVVSVMLAAVLMVAFGCVRNMEEAYRTINWESIVLIGGMIPMSIAIEKTGAAELLSNSLVGSLGSYGPVALLAGVYFTASLLTLFINNTACAVLLAPIAFTAAGHLGASPYPFLFAVSIGASMCFASPFSTPPNALVMSAGRYTFAHYIKVGVPLQIMLGIIMVIALPFFFPF